MDVAEAYPGGLLDVPVEQTWLPLVRYVPSGFFVGPSSVPDGTVTAEGRWTLIDTDGEFVVPLRRRRARPHRRLERGGLHAGGDRRVPTNWTGCGTTSRWTAGSSDVWAYVTTRRLLDGGPVEDERLDRVDWVLGTYAETPDGVVRLPAQLAVLLGLPALHLDETAAGVLAGGRLDDAILLALRGLAPEVLAGGWPVGDLAVQAGVDAVARLSYGRLHTDGRPERGRDVAVAKLFAAALGERDGGLQVAAYARSAEARLLCQLTTRPDPLEIAWLSVNSGSRLEDARRDLAGTLGVKRRSESFCGSSQKAVEPRAASERPGSVALRRVGLVVGALGLAG